MKFVFPSFLRVLFSVVVLSLISCSSDREGLDDGEKLTIVTTSTMVTDLLGDLVGEKAEVLGLMNEGVDPHSYKATIQDSIAIKDADLIFYSGLHLEGRLQHTLEEEAEKGRPVFAVTDVFSETELISAEEDFMGAKDPHVWGNAKLWSKTVDFAADKLCDADPSNASFYRENAKKLREDYLAVHVWALQRVNEIPEKSRVLITSHDAFFYFGDAYGFEVSGLQGVSTESQASLKDRAKLVAKIKASGVKAIFPESSVNAKGIKAVASEAGINLSHEELFSDAMGKKGEMETVNGETYDKGTYVGMIKHNINTVVESLK